MRRIELRSNGTLLRRLDAKESSSLRGVGAFGASKLVLEAIMVDAVGTDELGVSRVCSPCICSFLRWVPVGFFLWGVT